MAQSQGAITAWTILPPGGGPKCRLLANALTICTSTTSGLQVGRLHPGEPPGHPFEEPVGLSLPTRCSYAVATATA
jgi:hypothetical protein